jgi:hypothetical protein
MAVSKVPKGFPLKMTPWDKAPHLHLKIRRVKLRDSGKLMNSSVLLERICVRKTAPC